MGDWVSGELGRENGSRVGKAIRGKRERERAKKEKSKL